MMVKGVIIAIFFFWCTGMMTGQTKNAYYLSQEGLAEEIETSGLHELTIYVIPSRVKYDWSSPRTLYRSFVKNYKRNLLKGNNYLLGHAFVELRTPLADERILTGMRSASRDEQKQMLLKDHYGLAILGADMEGELESAENLDSKIRKYGRSGQLAYIRFKITEEMASRMLEFFDLFKSGVEDIGLEEARYGGAFWPRYEHEGAGCSAFALSFLDVAGLWDPRYEDWKVEVNIPMDLIGGPYNDDKKVRLRDIKRYKNWSDDEGTAHMNFEPFEIYDPTLIFEWITDLWEKDSLLQDSANSETETGKAIGLLIDCRDLTVPEDEALMIEREKRSVFVDHYRQKYLENIDNP